MRDSLNTIQLIQNGVQLPEGYFMSSVTGSKKNKPLYNETNFAYKQDIDTLTRIRQQIIEQKFYKVAPADYMPVRIGEGAWSEELLTYTSFSTGEDFEKGIIDVANNSKIALTDTAIAAVRQEVRDWAKQLEYSLIDIQKAQRSGNWSLIEQKEKSRKLNWDLGIQKIAFLGHSSDSKITGLLNNPNVNINTTTITQTISSMNATQFQAFISALVGDYYANTNSTQLPDTFLIPTSDWLGLTAAASPDFPINSKIEYFQKAFKEVTRNPNAEMKPLAYGDSNNNNLGVNRYVLYNNESDTLVMDIPVDYTSTVVGSYNNFQFQSVAYGQFTGVQIYRDKEVLYFDF